jgi:hypothetical protein
MASCFMQIDSFVLINITVIEISGSADGQTQAFWYQASDERRKYIINYKTD